MAEKTFRSPNYYDSENDLSAPTITPPTGVPAAVIGTSNRGPAFVPVTMGTPDEYLEKFGDLDKDMPAGYAVDEFMKHQNAVTFIRVLGAGANSTSSDIDTTSLTGRVVSAGFKLSASLAVNDDLGRHTGVVQFLAAKHTVQTNETYGIPLFTDNSSFSGNTVNLIRGMLLMASGSRVMVLDGNEAVSITGTTDDVGTIVSGKFKLIISSSLGSSFASSDGLPGLRVLTASLDPTQPDYFAKTLNTNPKKFVEEQHLLYADFAVDAEVATATTVAVLSGSANTSETSGEPTTTFLDAFGSFDTRYRAPSTTYFISQPFGNVEYDLFKFEALDDGAYANTLYKVSITNIRASVDDANKFGTFTVQIRSWDDTDSNPNVLEQFPECNLNPNSENYVARVIGDRNVRFNFDATTDADRHVIATGKYSNQSKYVRIVMNDQVTKGNIPETSLPFGFRGLNVIKTNDSLTDTAPSDALARVVGVLGTGAESSLSGSVLPPVPFRFKLTKGAASTTATWPGEPNSGEVASPQLYWGVKFERNNVVLNPNLSSDKNSLLTAYSNFLGIEKLDALVTGSGADLLNNNKFTLSRVALSNGSISHLTASVSDHIREAAYIRNGKLDASTYTINDGVLGNRVTLATILAQDTAANFNKFSPFAKFTNMMAGGFDGVNILDNNARLINDKSTSFDAGGGAEANYVSPGLMSNVTGEGQANAGVKSYMTAIDIATEPQSSNVNLVAVPGIREPFITDYAIKKAKEYGLAMYIMDIPSYSSTAVRLYDGDTTKPDVDKTASNFESRAIDNDYGATYWPDVLIEQNGSRRRINVPASVAAMGAIGFSDRVSYPWFAPAGFNRAALDFVKNASVRLNAADKDRLYDARINPIATFPKHGFVVFGQKTLRISKSALDRVNVRRLLLEIKRLVKEEAKTLVFEQNNAETRNEFVSRVVFKIGLVQARQGIERFQVIANETNNTSEDVALNRMNGRIIVVPTRTIEFVAVDFVITQNGVLFV